MQVGHKSSLDPLQINWQYEIKIKQECILIANSQNIILSIMHIVTETSWPRRLVQWLIQNFYSHISYLNWDNFILVEMIIIFQWLLGDLLGRTGWYQFNSQYTVNCKTSHSNLYSLKKESVSMKGQRLKGYWPKPVQIQFETQWLGSIGELALSFAFVVYQEEIKAL